MFFNDNRDNRDNFLDKENLVKAKPVVSIVSIVVFKNSHYLHHCLTMSSFIFMIVVIYSLFSFSFTSCWCNSNFFFGCRSLAILASRAAIFLPQRLLLLRLRHSSMYVFCLGSDVSTSHLFYYG